MIDPPLLAVAVLARDVVVQTARADVDPPDLAGDPLHLSGRPFEGGAGDLFGEQFLSAAARRSEDEDRNILRVGRLALRPRAGGGVGRQHGVLQLRDLLSGQIRIPAQHRRTGSTTRMARLAGWLRRMLPLLALAGLAVFLARRREPRVWLATAVVVVACLGVARLGEPWRNSGGRSFPSRSGRASGWCLRAHAKDPGHNLCGFRQQRALRPALRGVHPVGLADRRVSRVSIVRQGVRQRTL